MASSEGLRNQRKGIELEKFKRRMIRSVARRIKEKKSDEELWEEMKKEIGSNCKKLWTRMRMLTLKKLKRLLEADDRMDLIGPVARMTLTDWLLFDLVIVHEKIDVIGRELLTGEYKSTVLMNLFSLVQRFEIEGRRGENLAEAWTAATVYYNSKGHQCSPMMLQRRWFQLKELTRHKFYKFWFNYRGNQRQLSTAKQDSPDELQKAIALRYPQIITQKFLTWEEGIEERLVILPDELGVKMRQRNLMKPSDTSAPDVVLIEPHVETIDLENVSDSDDEDDQKEVSDTESVVKVKNEPIDVDENFDAEDEFQIPPEKGSEFEEEIQRLQMVAENFDEASHNAENSEDAVVDPGRLDSENAAAPSDNANETEDTINTDNVADDDAILIDDDDDEDESNPQESNTESVIASDAEKETIIDESNPQESNTEPAMTSDAEKDAIIDESNTEPVMTGDAEIDTIIDTSREEIESNDTIAEISSVTSVGIKVENVDDVIEKNRTDDAVEMLPVISTVASAGIKVEQDIGILKEISIDNVVSITNAEDDSINEGNITETLPVISTISSEGVKVEIEIPPIDEAEDISPEHDAMDKPTDIIVKKDETKLNSLEEFDEAHTFNIADDGINFADDGIAYVEEEEDDIITIKDSSGSDEVKNEAESKNEDSDAESTDQEQTNAQKFDLKLLMYPVVYTTKLDIMPVFDDALKYEQVYDKESIDKIYALSKPHSKQSVTGSEQVIRTGQIDTNIDKNLLADKNDSAMSDDDLFNNEVENFDSENESIVDDSKRVKLSSYMLKKPKHRSYNPVLLCKNPDFNTRLKKLSVGFFMSARNRTLLQSCIPMTIDMSKAFEDKLIDGTLYLKECPEDATFVKKQDVEVTSAALVKPTTVQQSLMSIDDTLENELQKRMAERVRAINLPDISQVRRLNQHLLTAEVTPLRSQDKAQDKTKHRIGPACYIQRIKDDINNLLTQQKAMENSNANPIVTEMQPLPQIVQPEPQIVQPQVGQPQVGQPQATTPMVTINNLNPIIEPTLQTALPSRVNNKDTQQTEDPRSSNSTASKAARKPHRKAVYPTLAWNCRPHFSKAANQDIHKTDALLTIDTLYKMLSALDPSLTTKELNAKEKAKKKTSEVINTTVNKNKEKKDEETSGVNNTVIDITEDEAPAKKPKPKVSSTVIRLKDREYCCWYSYKLDYVMGNLSLDIKRRHKCRSLCKCCCRENYLNRGNAKIAEQEQTNQQTQQQNHDEQEKKAQQIHLAIESVINQSKPPKQKKTTCDVSIQIDFEDETQAEPVSDVSLRNAVLTRTIGTVEVPPLTSSNDVTAEITPIKMPLVRVYTTPKKLDNPVPSTKIQLDNPVPSTKIPPDEIVSDVSTDTFTEYKRRYLKRVLNTDAKPENKMRSKRSVLLNSKLCTCRPYISKVNQGHIEINGRNNCAVHKQVMKQSKVIVNKKFISNDNQPFFVGKGKILLTNVRMPSKDNERTLRVSPVVEKTAPVIQPTEVQTFALPAGVQVVLLPDQTLTYIVQPEVTLTPEECDILPQFLVAIQQQINATGITLPASHPNTNSEEVIDLDEEKSPNNVTPVPDLVPISRSKQSINEAKTNKDRVMEIDNLSAQKKATTENVDENKESISSGENIEASPLNENPESKISDTVTDSSVKEDASSENNELKPSADDAANKKSLLSDLMEMSGIMEEDLAPAPVIAAPQEPIILDTQNFVLQREVPRDELVTQTIVPGGMPSLQPITPKQHYTATNKHGTFELTAVTSFAELKYACDHSGVFFKLDLESGSLNSINVCIQKFPTKAKPTTEMSITQPIDLTDDPDISITGTTEGDSPTNQHSLVLKEVDEQSLPDKTLITTILQKKQRLMERLSNNLKPVNLQQSKKHVARILKRNHTFHRVPQVPFYSKKKLEKIEAKIDLVDSDAPMEEEYLVNSDDSSDDEPLIKKVKRKLGDEPTGSSSEPNQTEVEQNEIALIPENEQENSELDQSNQNTSVQDQSNVETEEQNHSNPETNVSINSGEVNQSIEQEMSDDYETDNEEEYEEYEDADDAGQTVAESMPVPTNLVLSGGALNAHNIPLNTTYKDGDESQDEDCILGV